MTKMSCANLKALLAAEKADTLSAMSSSKLSSERTDAMDYYFGDVSKDMPASDGRSRAVSTDVADTIEGLMPQLMDIFCGGDEVARFDPVGPEDAAAAEQETDYVNHVFMQKNPGFLILYSFIKDALLSKVGIVKVWWEEEEREERETYYDLTDEQFAIIVSDPEIEVIEHSSRPYLEVGAGSPTEDMLRPEDVTANAAALPEAPAPKLHDVTVVTRRRYSCARVAGVPPEEFGIERNARSIRDCAYCFHEVVRREADLIAAGYDAAQIKGLPSSSALASTESLARDSVDESRDGTGDDGINAANREILVTEHYVRMDYEGNGRPARYRVTTAGDDGEILRRNGEEDIVREEVIPFAAMTPVIVTHRFFGRSIADLVMDIQRIKTALLRGALDNLYLHNNPRVEVAEAYASETTLDDLLVSRPGGIVRTKQPGGLSWQVVPDITASVYPALQYFDAVREWRTGVSRQGQGIDPNALQNQVATIANQMFDAAQAKTKLIARIFAETGIRDLFALLHGAIRRNGSRAETVRLRNQWIAIDPRDWQERNDMTINVGLGTGSKAQQLSHVMAVIGLQRDALAAGKSNLVSDDNLFNAAREVTRLVGLKKVDNFFTDPKTQPAPAPAMPGGLPGMSLIELQQRAAFEKLQADIAAQSRKLEGDMLLAQQKFALERELKLLDAQIKREQQQQAVAAKIITGAGAATTPAKSADGTAGDAAEGGGQGAAAVDAGALVATLMDTLRQMTAPKRIVKNPDGSYTTHPIEPQ